MSIIYEVNVEIDADVYQAYIEWLRPHADHILALPGFKSASLCVPNKLINFLNILRSLMVSILLAGITGDSSTLLDISSTSG